MNIDFQRALAGHVPPPYIDPELLLKAEEAKAKRKAREEALDLAIRACGHAGCDGELVVSVAKLFEAYLKGE